MGTGEQKERDMVNELLAEGYGAMRLAASGAGGDHDLPDVFWSVGDHRVAAELKYRGNGTERCYVGAEELNDLRRFAERWSAIPVVVSRWSHDTDFYVQPTETAEPSMFTDSGNLRLEKDLRGRYYELFHYCNMLEKS